MKTYQTLSEAIKFLQEEGYTTDFNIEFDSIKCKETGKCLNPSDFEVTDYYRFDGMTDPDDDVVLYVIESKNHQMKGLLVKAYGAYSEGISDEILKKLELKHP